MNPRGGPLLYSVIQAVGPGQIDGTQILGGVAPEETLAGLVSPDIRLC